MEYTINKLSNLAGVSSRTLRYYDEIGLLKPLKTNHSGYRVYGEKEIVRLQQILFLRQFGLELNTIFKILESDNFNMIEMLESHLLLLEQQKDEISTIIRNVKQTIECEKGKISITDHDRFIGLQKKFYNNNYLQYQDELTRLYSSQQLDTYNKKIANMDFDEIIAIKTLNKFILFNLEKFIKSKENIPSILAHEIYQSHKRWLSHMINPLSCEIHLAIAHQYIADSRFKQYYDKNVEGCAELLYKIIDYYTSNN